MNKLFSLLAIFVMALGVNAQNDALNNLRRDVATSPIPASMLAAEAEQVIFGAHVRDDRPAVSPRNPSPPASAHRPAANNGGAKALKIDTLPGGIIKGPDFMLYPDGSSYLLQGGQWVQVAKATPAPAQAQPAPSVAPGNNTGGTATTANVPSALIMPPGAQALVQGGDWKVLGGQQGQANGQAAGAAMGALPSGAIALPGGGYIYKERVNGIETRIAVYADGTIVQLDDNHSMAVAQLNGTDILTSGGEAEAGGKRNSFKYGMREAAGHTGQYYRRGAGTVIANTVDRIVSGGVVGVGVGVPVYQQRTYGPVGYAQWQANQWWNKPCRTCR